MGEVQEKVLDLRSVFGLKATVTGPAVATDGAYVEIDVMLEPGGDTNIHYHPGQEETYQVLDGTLRSSTTVGGTLCRRGSRSRFRRERCMDFGTPVTRRSGSSTCTAPRSPSKNTWRRWTA